MPTRTKTTVELCRQLYALDQHAATAGADLLIHFRGELQAMLPALDDAIAAVGIIPAKSLRLIRARIVNLLNKETP